MFVVSIYVIVKTTQNTIKVPIFSHTIKELKVPKRHLVVPWPFNAGELLSGELHVKLPYGTNKRFLGPSCWENYHWLYIEPTVKVLYIEPFSNTKNTL